MCDFNKKKVWLHKYQGSSSVHKQLIGVDCDVGLFIGVTGSVLCMCAHLCVCKCIHLLWQLYKISVCRGGGKH